MSFSIQLKTYIFLADWVNLQFSLTGDKNDLDNYVSYPSPLCSEETICITRDNLPHLL